ncbi:uncharacterized protein LOC126679606 isoform X2 [Mercurialis annua]|uniref:uncharacterized protein LOC126679606 isoform X2 n=1 Tax=Mercurialis annua TaxID=3986 RepID=UPI00215E5AD6|nr:uncharacterized protein LOC126679606 isoform X2 [Mercurialis annua]
MMNRSSKAATFIPQPNCFRQPAALFHSSPVLERKRRSFWDSVYLYMVWLCVEDARRSHGYARRSRKLNGKHSVFNNVGAYVDYLFKNSGNDFDEDNQSSSRGNSWFRKQYPGGFRQNGKGNQGARRPSRNFQFCEDEVDIETIFRSAFGGNRYFYWSFINEENPQWRRSSNYSNYYARNGRYRFDDDYDSSSDSDNMGPESASDRLALGMSASGPLKIEDVKNAYRMCALKWHPDRHQGSSKAIAEEKFKHCSAAYQSLCDKLSPA